MARLDPAFGLVLIDARCAAGALAPLGVGVRDSSYTQDAPEPGAPMPVDPASTWRPSASRAQSTGLELYTIRAGFAEGRQGAEVLYRLQGDTSDSDWRSWQDPVIVTQFSSGASSTIALSGSATWGPSLAWDTVAACSTPDGVIIVTAVDDSLGIGQTWKFDTRTGLWSDGKQWPVKAPGLEGPIGMVYDEATSRAVLYSGTDLGATSALQQVAFYSTDEGATFLPFGRRTLGGSSLAGQEQGAMRIVPRSDLDWLMIVVSETNGAGTATQYASSDHGATFSLVDTCGTSNTGLWPVRTASNGFMVAYINASGSPCVRLLAAASAKFDDAAEIVIDSTRDAKLVVPVVDHDGTMYVYAQGVSAVGGLDELAVYRSTNGGLLWERFDCDVYGGGSTTTEWYEWGAAVAANGAIYLIGVGIGNAETDGSIAALRLGGWEQVAHTGGALGTIATHKRRFGYGGSVGLTSVQALVYFPIAYPTSLGWTLLGATAAQTLSSLSREGVKVSGLAGTTREWQYTASAVHTSAVMEAEFVVGDGSTRAALLVATGTHITVRLSDASTYEYEVTVHLANDGIALEDANSGATIESVAIDMDSLSADGARLWTRIKLQLTAGRVDWWYRQGFGDLAPVWVKGAGGTVSNGGAVTQSRCTWGVAVTSPDTVELYVRHLGIAFGGGWSYGLETIEEYEKRYSDGYRGHLFGRPVPGRGSPYPVPELTSTGTVGRISAAGGPTYLGERVVLPVSYGAPVAAVHPTSSPSPRNGWRATGNAEVKLVYNLADPRWYGDAIALLALGARPAQWVLETDDGAAGWTTHGTLDLTLASGLTYTRTGRVLQPNGGVAVPRFVRENELAGGYVVSGGGAAEIAEHPSGWWGGTDRPLLRLTLTAIGSFPSSGSDLAIIAPSGLLVVYLTTPVVRQYVRIRAAAAAVVPDGKYRAGTLAIGRVLGVGNDPSWRWSSERRLSVRRSRTSDGVSSARELGPPARTLTYTWSDTVNTELLRNASDRVAVAGGLPIGARGDAAALPELLSTIRSGEVPIVVVPQLPAASGSLLDREAFVYGRAAFDRWPVQGMYGREGVDEVVTIGALTVDELV